MDPEGRATEVLEDLPRWLWDGATLPVPVEAIADSHFSLRVRDADDLTSVPGAPAVPHDGALSGLLIVDAKEIWVNATEAASSPGRRRFTIGHELGHWCLHRTPHGTVFCRASTVHPETPSDTGPDIEDEASRFAGALLFPASLLRAEWDRLDGDLAALCERFGASKVATERAVFRVIRRPEVLEQAAGLTHFFWDDDAYDAWRAAHAATGFVVNESVGDPAASRLHRLSCSYLQRPAQPDAPRTRHPKWCSEDLGELRRAFPHVAACSRCKP